MNPPAAIAMPPPPASDTRASPTEGVQPVVAEVGPSPEIVPFDSELDSLSAEDREFWMRCFATC
jgi:hypothetical protein